MDQLPFPISNLLEGHPEAGPSHSEAAPSHPEALSHPDAVGVEGPLAFGRRNHIGRKKDWKKEDWPKESWKQVWKKEGRAGRRRAGRRRTGRRIQKMPRPKSIGEEMLGRSIICQTWKKERGTKGKKRKAWIEGQIMSLKQEGSGLEASHLLPRSSFAS